MLYFVYLSYRPNTAPANRALAFLKAADKLGAKIQVLFLLPDEHYSKIPDDYSNIVVKYCWERAYINHKFLKYLSYIYYLLSFRSNLKNGDSVYIYSLNDIIRHVVFKKGIKIFYEITECPEVSLLTTELCKPTLKKHVDFCKKLTGLFVISNHLKHYYIDKGVEGERIHVINMTVDPSRFEGLEKDSNVEKYIAYCGSAFNNKDGVDQLIKAFAKVTEQVPDIKLYIIGEKPTENDSSGNVELVQQLGLNDKIVFTGRIVSEEMPQMLKNAQVLALARPDNIQAKYGFPTKLGEYLLTGNPVVVTSVGDIPQYLKDGENAMVVPPEKPTLFAEKIVWLLNHPEDSKEKGEKGKVTALESFNAHSETSKMMAIIRNSK